MRERQERPNVLLVVEDDERLRYTLVRTLLSAGYEVLEADSGREALAMVRAVGVDLVLLDVGLPDISGAAVREELKATGRRAPLVVHLSGMATSAGAQADALEAGADGYLTKPVEARTLLAHVNALLRLRDAEAALVAQHTDELRALSVVGPQRAPEPSFTADLVARYGSLLDRAVEQRTKAVDDEVAPGVHALAEALASAGLGAGEVVAVHARVVESRTAGRPTPLARVAVEEGRVLLVQVLGNLCDRYRNAARAIGEGS